MKLFINLAFLFLLLMLGACASAGLTAINFPSSLQGGYKIYHATYGPEPAQKLDIYVPEDGGYAKGDVVVFFYGGRWQSGEKDDFRFIGATLARRGFVTVIPEFKKYPQVRFPIFVEDGARALAWVDDHIADYGGRNDRIHLAGHSSGAHMAALLTVDEHYLAAEGKRTGTVIRDFVGLAGPYAFTPDEPDLIDIFGPPANYPKMQATSFINGAEPPILLLYGQHDGTVKPYNHERLAAEIRKKNGNVRVITYPGLGHIGIVSTFSGLGPNTTIVDDMVKFMKENDQ